jgi:hypothetical protein
MQKAENNFLQKERKNWSQIPDGGLIPGQTGRLAVDRMITLTLTSIFLVITF